FRIGKATEWDENGNITIIENYKDGELKDIQYYENGKLIRTGNSKEPKEEGFYRNGRLIK
ncbi:MAG: toxin-antitoxin system YwqK family antitoxin, partial [Bacteroidota bacterium]